MTHLVHLNDQCYNHSPVPWLRQLPANQLFVPVPRQWVFPQDCWFPHWQGSPKHMQIDKFN